MRALSGAHIPSIEGLRHGGSAEQLRHAITPFGSGWRGIITVPEREIGAATMAGTIPLSKLADYVRSVEQRYAPDSRYLPDLKMVQQWAEATGRAPVIVNRNAPRALLRELVRHERIHSAHFSTPGNPFWQRQLDKAPDIHTLTGETIKRWMNETPESFLAVQKRGVESIPFMASETRQSLLNRIDLAAAGDKTARDAIVHEALQSTANMYAQQEASFYNGVTVSSNDAERIAWANQTNRNFFSEMRAAGIADSRTLPIRELRNFKPAVAEAGAVPVSIEKSASVSASKWDNLLKGNRKYAAGVGLALAAAIGYKSLRAGDGHGQKHHKSIKEKGSRKMSRAI